MPADGYLNFNTKIDTDGFKDGVKTVERHVKNFSSAIDKLTSKIRTAFNIAAVTAFGKALIDASADVKAAGSQFEQTFGDMQDAAEAAIARVAEPADILNQRLRGSASSIYAFAKTARMETSTAMRFMEDALQAAADSAAYYDRTIEDTMVTLQSFLKGNYENDAALGLSATEYTRNAKAMKMYGKKFVELSEAQKQLTLLEMVKEANALSGAMGQAAREADGWANVTGNLSEAWHQFLGVVGQPVLELAVPVVQQMTAALERMTEWARAAYAALAKVFGWEEKQAKPIEQAAAAQESLTEAVEETEKAQEGALASFDEIEVLASNTAKATADTAAATQNTVITDEVADSTNERAADTAWIDKFIEKLQELKTFIDRQLEPAINAIGNSFKSALSSVGAYIDAVIKPKLAEISKKYEISFGILFPDNLGELFKPIIDWFQNDYPAIIRTVTETALELLDPLARWFTEDFPPFVQSGFELVTTIVSGLLDTFSMVFNDIWTLVVDPFFATFVENILPVFTGLGTELFNTLTVVFEEVKRAFDLVWNDAIKPVLEFIGKAWSDFWTLVQEKWQQWGEPIFEQLRTAFENTGDTFSNIWNSYLKPVFEGLMEIVNNLWQNHVMPFLSSLLDLIGTIVSGALRIYNEFILPIINWFTELFAPIWTNLKQLMVDTWTAILGNIIDTATGIIDALTGLVNFVVGVFTGDWDLAWQGIQQIFEGIWNAIESFLKAGINSMIGFINGFVAAIVSGFNAVIRALNRIQVTIPDWVPVWGGKTFGINLPTITAPQIPYLATGAVIPPNREFLAVLGDQKRGNNIEAPEGLIREIVEDALAKQSATGKQTVILMLDKRELGRTILEVGSEEEHRIGARLVKA